MASSAKRSNGRLAYPSEAPTARGADRRVEIVSKAAQLFDTRGFHSTTMEDIADAVGLRKPTLYHYFKSKDDILFLIHDEFIEVLIGRHRHRLEIGVEPKILLLETMGDILELMETHPGYVRVFFEAHRELPQDKHDAIVEKRTCYQRMITEVLERLIAARDLRPVSADLVTQGLFGMCTWAYQWYRSDGPLRPRDIAYVFWDVLMNGLTQVPPSLEDSRIESVGSQKRP
jgi:TetR/AcrR family transcriptional regulator, cholesterol catabolism regulator